MNLLVDWKLNKNIFPYSQAITSTNSSLTYSELEKKITSQAYLFQDKGIKEKALVPIISENNSEYIINIFALWNLGAVPVPVNTRFTKKETRELLAFINCNYLIINDNFRVGSDLGNYNVISGLSSEIFEKGNSYIPNSEETAVIIFTSGSSGKPKGVELSFNNLIQSAIIGNQFLNQTSFDRWLASLPFYHIGGFSIITRAILHGASIIIPDSLSTEDLCNSFLNEKPTLASLVSTQISRFIEAGQIPNEELRKVLLGGGFISEELVHKALHDNWKISKVYGSSETASMITAIDCTKGHKTWSSGKALEPNEILIIDDNNSMLTPDNAGQIIVQGPAVAKGYLTNPEETLHKFINGYYYTGDIGFLDEEGYLFIEARKSDLIITGGENVNPVEVEKEMLMHPEIIEAAVFPVDDAEWGQIIAAAIITIKNKEITLNQIKDLLKDKIAGYKIPKKIFIVDELPKTSMGKIQREKLKELYLE